MTFMDKMNYAIEYIEENLTGEIDYEQAARRAYCSSYHFLRMFSYMADIPLSEYIRRRKLTQAAFDLSAGAKVINVSSKYGYGSPEAFSRAFKQMHGMSPIAARSGSKELKAYPKLVFKVSMVGDTEINYRIVNKQKHVVCGIATDVPKLAGKTNSVISSFWYENIANGTIERFHRDIGLSYDTSLNAVLYNFRQSAFSYMICYEVAPEAVPDGYAVLSIPALTWATFSTEKHPAKHTAEQVRTLRDRIFKEWLPTSGYTIDSEPQLEIFKNDGHMVVVEICMPVRRF